VEVDERDEQIDQQKNADWQLALTPFFTYKLMDGQLVSKNTGRIADPFMNGTTESTRHFITL
jgi:hypothetical protein